MNENSFSPLEDVFNSLQESFYQMTSNELLDYVVGIDIYKEVADCEEDVARAQSVEERKRAEKIIESLKNDIEEISEHYANSNEIRVLIVNSVQECEEKINDIIVLLSNTAIYHYLARLKSQLKKHLDSNFEALFFERCLPKELDNKFAIELAWIFYGHYQSMLMQYRDLIDQLQHKYITCRITSESETEMLRRVFYDSETIFTISEDLNLSQIRNRSDKKLSISDHAIGFLFHYLKKNETILNHSTASLSKIVSTLTGISEQKLRTNYLVEALMFGKDVKEKGTKNEALTELQSIINKIQSQIDYDLKS